MRKILYFSSAGTGTFEKPVNNIIISISALLSKIQAVDLLLV